MTQPTPPTPQSAPAVGATATPQELQAGIRDIAQQLKGLTRERELLREQLRAATGAEREVVRDRLVTVDRQLAQTQADLSRSVEEITKVAVNRAVRSSVVVQPSSFGRAMNIDPDAVTAVFVMASVGLIVPISVGLARRLWRRPAAPVAPREAELVSSARLDRLEQSVDAIAIEIERISEGQRFVTRLLSERAGASRPVLDAGDAPALGKSVNPSTTPH